MVFLAMMTDDGCQGNPMDKSPRKRNGGPTEPDHRRGVTAPPGMLQWPPRPSNNLLGGIYGKIPWENAGDSMEFWSTSGEIFWLKPGVFGKLRTNVWKAAGSEKKKLGCKKSIANLPNKQDHLTRRNNHVLPIRIVTSIQMGRWPLTIGVLGQLISWKIPWLFKVYIVTPDPDVPERILQWYSHACCSSWMK